MTYLRRAASDLRDLVWNHREVLAIAMSGALVLVASQLHGRQLASLFVPGAGPESWPPGWEQLVVKLARGAILLLPLALLPLLRLRPAEVGIGVGRPRTWLRDTGILFALLLPFLFWAASRPEFRRAYPYFPVMRVSAGWFVAGLAARGVYMFCWEFLFRGWLLLGTARRAGPAAALAISTVPFVAMHLGKPVPEVYASVVAGLALGVLVLRGRSVIPAFLLHWAAAATLDLLALSG